MLKKKNYKESGLTLPVYDFRQCFLVRVHQAFPVPLSLFLNPKKAPITHNNQIIIPYHTTSLFTCSKLLAR